MKDLNMRLPRALLVIALVAGVLAIAPPPALSEPAPVAAAATATSSPSDPGGASAACLSQYPDIGCRAGWSGETKWLTELGIVSGYGDGTFRTTAVASRQVAISALYRLFGSPEGPFPDPGYSDVAPGDPFYDAIAWLADTGLVHGYLDGSFRPTAPLYRQAFASLLHGLEGAPPGPFADPGFVDVGPGHPFTLPIFWSADHGLTTGYGDGTFRGASPLRRGDLSGFLARLLVRRGIDPETADRCEFLDASECLLVWPSNHLTTDDATMDTGRRLNLDSASIPTNLAGDPVDPDPLNANDGFSPGTPILALIPGLDPTNTGMPPLGDLSMSLDLDSPIVVLDADTGELHPIWAELDAAGDPGEVPLLFIRPGVNFLEGHRYVVVIRELRNAANERIEPEPAFRAYRDEIETAVPAIEGRRAHMRDDVIGVAEDAGLSLDEAYLAWDFTVASERNLSERLLHIRDDAFADLGAEAPTFSITSVEDLTIGEDADIARRVEGTFEVPLYLTDSGEPGTQFNWGLDGLPERNGTFTANFTCRIPHASSAESPARLSLYGHGLLGGRGEVNAGNVRSFANEHNIVFCATDWIGMASEDVPNVASILLNVSNFPTLADRAQQGILNTLFLGRVMKHADGFAGAAAFQDAGTPLIDTGELFFDGNSQGAIMGGAATAVAQDWTRAVLGVPGMNYSLLLQRSSDWPLYESFMETAYPERLDQQLGMAIIQTLWDRAETNGYAQHLTDDPYPGTPEHQVLLHVAFADFQVSMWSAEIEARTIGASIHQPALADGRHPDANPFWNLPVAPADGTFTGSVLVYWDSGTPAPPSSNLPPTVGSDPHGKPRSQAIARDQKSAFFDGVFVDTCSAAPCLAP